MVLLEAMYFGSIVITTPNGGSNMLVHNGENGVVLPKDDAAKWAQSILDIQNSPEKKQTMRKCAHERIASDFTWDKLADKFIECYEMLKKR